MQSNAYNLLNKSILQFWAETSVAPASYYIYGISVQLSPDTQIPIIYIETDCGAPRSDP